MRSKYLLVLVLTACSLLVGCSKKQEPSTQLREVRVRLDWTPWAPHAAFYAADSQGYFKEEKIKVKLYVPPDPEATIKLVAGGQDDIGVSYMTDTIFAREQGFKVVSVAALVPHPLNCIMALMKSGIDSPSKLKGKIIGTTGVPSDAAFLDWVLSRNGVKKGTYKVLTIGFSLAEALKSGNVDAIVGAYWPWEGIKLKQDGYPVNVMKLQEYGVPDYYELVLVTREDIDPDLLRKFLRASMRGQEFVLQHPDQAVDILHKASPELTPEFLSASLQAMIPQMHSSAGVFRQEEARWSEMVGFMQTTGLLTKPVSPSSSFTNQFLPQNVATKTGSDTNKVD
jgi:putative hydroxymethylpyrimidine transport system substrate-binding protein